MQAAPRTAKLPPFSASGAASMPPTSSATIPPPPEGHLPPLDLGAPAPWALNERAVVRVLWITLLLNATNCTLKFVVGLISGNLTVISDAMHGVLDGANNIVGIFTLRYSYRPSDEDHPYGHRKFEAVAALIIGFLMGLTAWEIAQSVFERMTGPAEAPPAAPAAWYVALILGSLAINVFITLFETRRGRALGSPFLLADAAHTRSDIYVTLMSLSSLFLAPKLPFLDQTLAMLVVLMIFRAGWRIVRDNLLLLTDTAQLDPGPIKAVAETIAGVGNCHAIRSHGMPDQVHLDLHIVVSEDITARQAQDIEALVRAALLRAFPMVAEVAIHHQTETPRTNLPLGREHLQQRQASTPDESK